MTIKDLGNRLYHHIDCYYHFNLHFDSSLVQHSIQISTCSFPFYNKNFKIQTISLTNECFLPSERKFDIIAIYLFFQ